MKRLFILTTALPPYPAEDNPLVASVCYAHPDGEAATARRLCANSSESPAGWSFSLRERRIRPWRGGQYQRI